MTIDIIILAAGKGTRMKSELPKVMHQIDGQSMLARVITTAKTLNPKKIISVIGYGADIIKKQFQNDQALLFALQEQQLGTGHAVQQALPFLSEEFTLILYGDVPLISKSLLEQLVKISSSGLGLITFEKENPTGYGRIVRHQGQIQKITEEKDCDNLEKQIKEINTGIMCIKTDLLINWLGKIDNKNAQQEYYLTDIIALAVSDKIKVGHVLAKQEHEIQGVNSVIELISLERIVLQDKAKQLIEAGVRIQDPNRIDIRGELVCEEGVSIDVGCIFEGQVFLKKNVSVGPYNIIKDTTINEASHLQAFNHIDSALIGKQCKIGPYTRIRPGSELNQDVHLGNFVETKNTKIDDHSKVNHLSYIGDSQIGKNVNVGAGTITCNYDGANKHLTTIEDDVFIGSDTQLIAPVTIKKGSTIGAGSTITKDTEANKLTISRAQQVTIESWDRPKKK
ncbi:MAG: bifunctional UDP-N-acetylglucosamine diphosphorylase/glucosamine-1-phosphate N-acetyltransferase GlmU [Nitrosomonadales bacterium]